MVGASFENGDVASFPLIRPDSGRLGAFERRPEGGGLYKHFRIDDAVDWTDETA